MSTTAVRAAGATAATVLGASAVKQGSAAAVVTATADVKVAVAAAATAATKEATQTLSELAMHELFDSERQDHRYDSDFQESDEE